MDVSVCIVNSVACFFAAVGGCLVLGRIYTFVLYVISVFGLMPFLPSLSVGVVTGGSKGVGKRGLECDGTLGLCFC